MGSTNYSKPQLIADISQELDVPAYQAEKIVNAVYGRINDALLEGRSVRVANVGTLKVKQYAARSGVSPKNGAAYENPACVKVAFTRSEKFESLLNE